MTKHNPPGVIIYPQQDVDNDFDERISTIKKHTTLAELLVLNLLLQRLKEGSQLNKNDLYNIGCDSPHKVIASLRSLGVIIKTVYVAEWINPYHFSYTTKYELVG